MDYRAMFKGEYVAAAEFQGKEPTLTIKSLALVTMVEAPKAKGEEERTRQKGVVHFEETDRGWVMNRTNAESLAAMFGPETSAWIGKRVKLAAVQVQFGKERVPGIRVVGSPDISAPVAFELKLPRKRPVEVTLLATGGAPAKGRAPAPQRPDPAPTRPPLPPPREIREGNIPPRLRPPPAEEGPPDGYQDPPPDDITF